MNEKMRRTEEEKRERERETMFKDTRIDDLTMSGTGQGVRDVS